RAAWRRTCRNRPLIGVGSMAYAFDDARGQAIGSRIAMTGSAYGLRLEVGEVVTERLARPAVGVRCGESVLAPSVETGGWVLHIPHWGIWRLRRRSWPREIT